MGVNIQQHEQQVRLHDSTPRTRRCSKYFRSKSCTSITRKQPGSQLQHKTIPTVQSDSETHAQTTITTTKHCPSTKKVHDGDGLHGCSTHSMPVCTHSYISNIVLSCHTMWANTVLPTPHTWYHPCKEQTWAWWWWREWEKQTLWTWLKFCTSSHQKASCLHETTKGGILPFCIAFECKHTVQQSWQPTVRYLTQWELKTLRCVSREEDRFLACTTHLICKYMETEKARKKWIQLQSRKVPN